MNKITTTGLLEPTSVEGGQIYVRESTFYIVCYIDHTDSCILIDLSTGYHWTSARSQAETLQELKDNGFKRFTGQLTITT